jgi:hypothetical protein
MEKEIEFKKCPDCQVDRGERHEYGCDVTQCRHTGTQLLTCGFRVSIDPGSPTGYSLHETNDHECEPCIWTGEWPGVKVCRENGWYTEIVGFEGPTEDLNSVQFRAVWNTELEDWVVRK